jgi:DHA2 family multidrug resistance protein
MSAGAIPDSVVRNRPLIMATTMLASSIYSLNLTIVSISLPHMQGTFSATPDQIAWVVTAFLVGMTTMIVATGWVSRRIGRKRLFALSLAVFTSASLMCGAAQSLEAEVLWRFLQGVAGAPIIPLSQAIAVDAYPPNQHGRAISIWGFGNMIGPIVAPPIGGFLTELYGWPAVFSINLPLGVVALLATLAVVPDVPPDRQRRFDWLGFAFLAGGLIAIQLMLNRGTRLDWFASTEIIVEAVIGSFLLYLFVVRVFTARDPLLKPDMFRDRAFVVSAVVAFSFGLLVFLQTILLPLLLKNLRGYPIEMIGLLLAPRALGVLVGNLAVGAVLSRIENRTLVAFGFLGVSASSFLMSGWTLELGPWDVAAAGFLQGVCGSFMFVPTATRGFDTLPRRHQEEALPFFYLTLNIGASVGIAATFTYWTASVQENHASLVMHINRFNPLFKPGALPDLWSLANPLAIEIEIVRQASMIAYNDTFFAIALVALAGAPAIFLMRRHRPSGSAP